MRLWVKGPASSHWSHYWTCFPCAQVNWLWQVKWCFLCIHVCIWGHTQGGWCKRVRITMNVCAFQRLMGCWAPPLVAANTRQRTTYYYWSTPGQNNSHCVSRYCFLILEMDSTGSPLIRTREGTRESIELQRNTDQQAARQRVIKTETLRLSGNRGATERVEKL